MLIAAAWLPDLPVLSAMGLVALGATAATILHLVQHKNAVLLLAAHLCIYGSLYALFVGATWNAHAVGSRPSWQLVRWLDLTASLCIMALAARWAIVAIGRNDRGEDATVV